MKGASHGAVIGIPVGSVTYPAEEVSGKPICGAVSSRRISRSYGSSQLRRKKVDAVIGWMNKFSKKADSYAQGIREHVRLGPKISDTLKGKLNLGARILQAGGVERAFRQIFGAREGEKLLKGSQCYLSTTAGPIAGMLFISTEKIAFHSDRSLTVTSPTGETVRIPYKVTIPLRKINRANQSEDVNKPSQKYIQIATVDDFEFWFMGFVSYNRSVKYVQKAICFAQ
uniref:GEM-like protein 4 n=1 Tax=Anthurium amnicola TaxID=1678845 RepID=A0A1D1YVK2_9ARAE